MRRCGPSNPDEGKCGLYSHTEGAACGPALMVTALLCPASGQASTWNIPLVAMRMVLKVNETSFSSLE